jgi:hypothetical protein
VKVADHEHALSTCNPKRSAAKLASIQFPRERWTAQVSLPEPRVAIQDGCVRGENLHQTFEQQLVLRVAVVVLLHGKRTVGPLVERPSTVSRS